MQYQKIRITLENDFHGTSTTVYARRKMGSDQMLITRLQVLRSARKLCGVDGCLCGGDAGQRDGTVVNLCPGMDLAEISTGDYDVLPGTYSLEFPNDPTSRIIKYSA